LGRGQVILAIGLIVAAAAPAAASGTATGDQAQLIIQGSIEPRCDFSDVPATANLGALVNGQTKDIGALRFRCNLADQGNVTLTVQSEQGGLHREGGEEVVAYAASWDVQGNGNNFVEASSLTTPVTFVLASGTAAADEGGMYRVRVTGGTDTLIAGTYRDRITYTISP
jgi:hypothetical protein